MKVIIDTKSSEKHFILMWADKKPFCWINKAHNTLEDVKEQIGIENIMEVV